MKPRYRENVSDARKRKLFVKLVRHITRVAEKKSNTDTALRFSHVFKKRVLGKSGNLRKYVGCFFKHGNGSVVSFVIVGISKRINVEAFVRNELCLPLDFHDIADPQTQSGFESDSAL